MKRKESYCVSLKDKEIYFQSEEGWEIHNLAYQCRKENLDHRQCLNLNLQNSVELVFVGSFHFSLFVFAWNEGTTRLLCISLEEIVRQCRRNLKVNVQ